MKKKSLLKIILIRLVVLGFFILLGTGLASGIQLYRERMDDFRAVALNFINEAIENIDAKIVDMIIEERDHFDPYTMKDADADEVTDPYESMVFLYLYWWKLQNHFIYTESLSDDIRRCYMVVPGEEDLICLWDAETDETEALKPFEHRNYAPGEKENLTRAMTGGDEPVFAYYRRDELIWTVMREVRTPDQSRSAVLAIDFSLNGMLSAYRKLMLNMAVMLFIILSAACAAFYVVLKRSLMDPLISMEQKTNGLVDRLKSGSEEPLRMEIHTGDEIESLARAMEDMGESLVTYIRESEQAAAEKEHIASEMRLAASIQTGMLPDLDAFLRDQKEIALSAGMYPANAVGGDFYDAFPIDEEHVAFVIADASGKGIPAALFMAITKTLIRSYASDDLHPASILTKVNNQICSSNKDKMFVTVWMGILNTVTGMMKACNAGHEYPVLKSPDGNYELLSDPHSFIIGIRKDMPLEEYELQLRKGSLLFVYTDGVTEAMNTAEELFGPERMLAALNGAAPQTPAMVLDVIKTAVYDFSQGKEQHDDITVMCLQYIGKNG